MDPPIDKERIVGDEKGVRSLARQRRECGIDLADGADVENLDLQSATVTALSEPTVRAKFELLGVVVESSTPEGLGALLQFEIDKWGPIIKAAGISASN